MVCLFLGRFLVHSFIGPMSISPAPRSAQHRKLTRRSPVLIPGQPPLAPHPGSASLALPPGDAVSPLHPAAAPLSKWETLLSPHPPWPVPASRMEPRRLSNVAHSPGARSGCAPSPQPRRPGLCRWLGCFWTIWAPHTSGGLSQDELSLQGVRVWRKLSQAPG